jgi:hypothetical protein
MSKRVWDLTLSDDDDPPSPQKRALQQSNRAESVAQTAAVEEEEDVVITGDVGMVRSCDNMVLITASKLGRLLSFLCRLPTETFLTCATIVPCTSLQ